MEFRTNVESSETLYWFWKYLLYVIPLLIAYALFLTFDPANGEGERTTFFGGEFIPFGPSTPSLASAFL